ncbi:Putative zinc finger and SCAN domain-containing protein 5C [Eumeta japonica]|uniref:Zinc finger and SCAN domain-containing protein 5C n=1 Tax=Eumeta variegata TaxID=151549 RepID=A0A4C1UBG3_EUMVA|nr:Putative zinc finger and SCAN domain-containing protein 5C [Eumeta japonica]
MRIGQWLLFRGTAPSSSMFAVLDWPDYAGYEPNPRRIERHMRWLQFMYPSRGIVFSLRRPTSRRTNASLRRNGAWNMLWRGDDVHKDDGLPQKICIDCKEIIEQSVNLKSTSKKAEDTLLAMGFTKSIPRQDDFGEMKSGKDNLKINVSRCNSVPWSDTHSADENNISNECVPNDLANDLQNISESNLKILERKEQIISDELYKYLLSNADNHHDRDTITKICGKRCHNRTSLTFHMRSRHGGERRDVCSFCQYRAINKEQLKIHERRHTGEKPYICAHCNASFHRRANLVQHLDIHLTEKTIQAVGDDMVPYVFVVKSSDRTASWNPAWETLAPDPLQLAQNVCG